jgi:hypothetical protein
LEEGDVIDGKEGYELGIRELGARELGIRELED